MLLEMTADCWTISKVEDGKKDLFLPYSSNKKANAVQQLCLTEWKFPKITIILLNFSEIFQ